MWYKHGIFILAGEYGASWCVRPPVRYVNPWNGQYLRHTPWELQVGNKIWSQALGFCWPKIFFQLVDVMWLLWICFINMVLKRSHVFVFLLFTIRDSRNSFNMRFKLTRYVGSGRLLVHKVYILCIHNHVMLKCINSKTSPVSNSANLLLLEFMSWIEAGGE